MEISQVSVKLSGRGSGNLQGFATVTFDGEFVVRDIKIIEGPSGFFIAMPSRKLTDRCSRCHAKNHLKAKFCGECGNRLGDDRASFDAAGRAKLHVDVAHPINSNCRKRLQDAVVSAYREEVAVSGEAEPVPEKEKTSSDEATDVVAASEDLEVDAGTDEVGGGEFGSGLFT